jgi:molybdenum cofactor cytidylyltransferase
VRPVTGILLAAGAGRRFGVHRGGHKLLQVLPDGEPLGVAAGRNLVAVLPDSIAVVRAGDRVLAAALGAIGLRIVEHPGADDGLGTSLAAGVAATPNAAGWLIALGDMPWVQPETILALTEALAAGATLVAPLYAGRRGHPVGFAAVWGDRLMSLKGDQGARDLIAAHSGQLVLLPTQDPGVLLDVDTLADLDACASINRSAEPGD